MPLGRKLSLVLDVETTGVNPALDRIAEIAVILTDWHSVYAVLSTYINPGFSFENHYGLTDKEVKHAPSLRELCTLGLPWLLRSCDEFVAHQANFDLRFLSVELHHVGLQMPLRPVFDTFRLARYALAEACERYKINTSDVVWHTAIGDAVATFRLAQKLRSMQLEEPEEASFGFRPAY